MDGSRVGVTPCQLRKDSSSVLEELSGGAGSSIPEPEAAPSVSEAEVPPSVAQPEAVPEPDAASSVPELKAASSVPEAEAAPSVPEPDTASSVPEIKPAPSVPELKPAPSVPEPENAPSVPEPEVPPTVPEPELRSEGSTVQEALLEASRQRNVQLISSVLDRVGQLERALDEEKNSIDTERTGDTQNEKPPFVQRWRSTNSNEANETAEETAVEVAEETTPELNGSNINRAERSNDGAISILREALRRAQETAEELRCLRQELGEVSEERDTLRQQVEENKQLFLQQQQMMLEAAQRQLHNSKDSAKGAEKAQQTGDGDGDEEVVTSRRGGVSPRRPRPPPERPPWRCERCGYGRNTFNSDRCLFCGEANNAPPKRFGSAHLGMLTEHVGDGSRGVRLRRVSAGGPAFEAGLRQGDYVLSIGGRAMKGGGSLHRTLNRVTAGQSLAVVFQRGNRRGKVTIVAGRKGPRPKESARRSSRTDDVNLLEPHPPPGCKPASSRRHGEGMHGTSDEEEYIEDY